MGQFRKGWHQRKNQQSTLAKWYLTNLTLITGYSSSFQQIIESELTSDKMLDKPGDIVTKLDTSSFPPISNNLYPAPAHVTTVCLEKNPGEMIGIEFKKFDLKTFIVSGIVDDSIVSRTDMKIGQEILAVNGEPIKTLGQLSQIIRSNRELQFTLLDPTVNRNPYCYVEVATDSMLHPMVSFERCCNDTMVMIGNIFMSDLTKTRLQSGDIVVAVNGVPVWQPDQAREVQVRAAMKSEPFVFYCINMEELRDVFIAKVPKNIEVLTILSTQFVKMYIRKLHPSTIAIKDERCSFYYRVNVNRTTQKYEFECREADPDTENIFHTTSKSCNWIMDALNTLMDQQLEALKKNIVENAWKATLVLRRNTVIFDDVISSVVAERQREFIWNPDRSISNMHEIPVVVEAVPVHESVAL